MVLLMNGTELIWGFTGKIRDLRNIGPSFKVISDKNSPVNWTNGSKINDPISYSCYKTPNYSRNCSLLGVFCFHLTPQAPWYSINSTALKWFWDHYFLGFQVCWKDYIGIIHWRLKNRAALILKIFEAVIGLSWPRACGQCLR